MHSYDSKGEAAPLTGQGHTNLVSGLIGTPDGRVFTAGYDDHVREVDGSGFTYVFAFLMRKKNNANENTRVSRASVFITGSQPKALAAASDNTVFVAGVEAVEAVRNNQKVAELRPGASATAIAAAGSLIAVGFGVGGKSVRAYRGVCSPPDFLYSSLS